MMLTAKNIHILGGEDDDLLITNAYENVLLRALNKPITQTPKRDYVEELYSGDTTKPVNSNIAMKPIISSSIRQNDGNNHVESEIRMLEDINFDDLEMIDEIEQNELNKSASAAVHEAMDFDDDDDFLAQLESIEKSAQQSLPATTSSRTNVISVDDHDTPAIVTLPTVSSSTTTLTFPANQSQIINLSDEVIPRKVARVEPIRVPSPSDDNYPYKIYGENLVTLDQYQSLKLTERLKRNFIVWAKIASFNQIKLRKGGWDEFHTNLEDNFSDNLLPVMLTTPCLDSISSTSAAELCLMYTESRKRPQLRSDIEKVFAEVQQHLNGLECFMELQSQMPTPGSDGAEILVVELIETWNSADFQILNRKAKEENLKILL
jgi:RecQ-mediated genome instability protein 1